MIRILLADDHTLLRQGIRSLLELSTTPVLVDELADGEDVVPFLKRQPVDVVLLDIQMPIKGGIEVLEDMRENDLTVPVIVLTTFDDDSKLLRCAELGARAFMLKDVGKDQLLSTIAKVVAGEVLIHHAVTERVLQGFNRYRAGAARSHQVERLTPRETEVLRFICGGYSNREIGRAIHLSEGTVKNHVSVILSKLGVRDRTRAVIKGLELGLLD